MTVPRAGINAIDEAHLWSFMRSFAGGAFDESRARDYPTAEILEKHLLLADRNVDELVPTVAGLLLFGRDESVAEFLPRASVIVTRFSGDNSQAPIIERTELHGSLATVYESALQFMRRYCDLWDSRPARFASEATEAPVVARANYSRSVVSEAIANALIHRDLVVRDVNTRVHIFDRSIEIVNPRRSAGFAPAALKAIRFGVSERLNPQLASIFSNPAYDLKLATGGLPTLLREAKAFSGKLPEIVAFNDEFRLRIHGV
jgi:predicted HTH transcriptional regulator